MSQSLQAYLPPIPSIPEATALWEEKQALQERLIEVDAQIETIEQLRNASLEMRPPDDTLDIITQMVNASVHKLFLMTAPAEALADRFFDLGEAEMAEKAHHRILCAYRACSDLRPWLEFRNFLQKLAKRSRDVGELIHAEKFLWEALGASDQREPARLTDYVLLKELAQTLPKSSEEILKALKRTSPGTTMNLPSYFPPLQRMMQSDYARHQRGSPFHSGPFLDEELASDDPVVGGLNKTLELIRDIPLLHLDERNFHRQTPLHMAVSKRMEALSRAIIMRMKEIPAFSLQRAMDSKDDTEQGILETAIWSGCSTHFIEHLIENGAQVNPLKTVKSPMNPLQAAVVNNLGEVVDLLLLKGAEVERVFPGTDTPIILAQKMEYFDIAEKLEAFKKRTIQVWEPN
ncbi:hypothetical protein BKA65DRAFT_473570 [Rhexocercosporidium sp. MPI-PUGE-AT-0058]|nr:hypothetical protein BKA65DRAFT_473570 [Rhexocercosporidium sp. MPI-PUGE-AT-0058]